MDATLLGICVAGLGITLAYFKLRMPRRNNSVFPSSTSPGSFEGFTKPRRILFVTAHPDDECMFFAPSILHFSKKENALVYLLCLSNGNYYGLGRVRQQELLTSCVTLGIAKENVIIYRSDDLPDDPDVIWPASFLGSIVCRHAHELDVNVVVTFDSSGISGHKNHCSVYYAVQNLVQKNKLPQDCVAYSLDSVNLARKYSSFLDIPISYAISARVMSTHFTHYFLIKKAMKAHRSQDVWFRKLYMIFSRYVIINTLSEIHPEST